MNKRTLKLLLLPCLMMPNMSCNSSIDEDGYKKVKHIDFAFKAIECINKSDNFSKVTINGTCQYFDYKGDETVLKINNVEGIVENKEIILDQDAFIFPNRGNLNGYLYRYYNPYYYICYDDSPYYNYYINDNGCKMGYSDEFSGYGIFNYVYEWNSYGLLNYYNIASCNADSYDRIELIVKVNLSYE